MLLETSQFLTDTGCEVGGQIILKYRFSRSGGTRSEIAVPALACLELVELDERVNLHRGQRPLQLLAAEELRLDVLPGPLLAADAACREHLSCVAPSPCDLRR